MRYLLHGIFRLKEKTNVKGLLYFTYLFFAKVLDNALSTARTIFLQRNQYLIAGIALTGSSYLYYLVTKNIVAQDSNFAILVISVASGVGCWIAGKISEKLSKERLFIHVIMSDDKAAMQAFRDFLASKHITNTASDTYTLDWDTKSITVTAYSQTKEESRMIDRYIAQSESKFKHIVQVT